MSHSYTEVEIVKHQSQIESTDKLLTLGSCFSDHIGQLLTKSKFDAIVNPLGIVFNPISLAKSIKYIIENQAIKESNLDLNKEIHFHYDFHSKLSALSKDILIQNINSQISKANQQLKKSNWLIITLGTSIVHELAETGEVVANCHKMSSNLFNKRMISSLESYDKLKSIFDQLQQKQIIITVSPIRHTREGLVENQRSKSRLIETAHLLAESMSNVSYFPAYEILMDQLRDYRYYARDMIHPSEEATHIVWESFQNFYFSEKALQKTKDFEKFNTMMNHRPQFDKSEAHKKFLLRLESEKRRLSNLYPEVLIK